VTILHVFLHFIQVFIVSVMALENVGPIILT